MRETFGERLARLRANADMKPADLAQRVGLTEGAIRHMENGNTKQASLSAGLRIARVLDVSPWFLAFGTEAKDDHPRSLESEVRELQRVVRDLEERVVPLLEDAALRDLRHSDTQRPRAKKG